MWTLIIGLLQSAITPLANWLTALANSNAQIKVNAQTEAGAVITAADTANSAIRQKEGGSSPWVLATIVGFMLPFGWHTWQIVLDSSHWIPILDWWHWIPYPSVDVHVIGSWHVARLPGMFEETEKAVINSLFIGAGAVLALSGFLKK